MDDALTANTQINGTSALQDFQEQKDAFKNTWDYTFLTVMIASMIGLLILSWYLDSNPAVFFVLIFIVVVVAGLAGFLSNAFADIAGDALLGGSFDNFPITSFIMNNYMMFIIVQVFLMMLVFFGKPGGAV